VLYPLRFCADSIASDQESRLEGYVICLFSIYGTLRSLDKTEEMLGSFPPSQLIEKKLALEEAPSGMFMRGTYSCQLKFLDDDHHVYLDVNWSLEVSIAGIEADILQDQEELGVKTFSGSKFGRITKNALFKDMLKLFCKGRLHVPPFPISLIANKPSKLIEV
jgi:RHO protein GDP dissociation inhibitor